MASRRRLRAAAVGLTALCAQAPGSAQQQTEKMHAPQAGEEATAQSDEAVLRALLKRRAEVAQSPVPQGVSAEKFFESKRFALEFLDGLIVKVRSRIGK